MKSNEASITEIREQTREGAFWSSMGMFVQEVFQFAFGIVMARLLLPEVFGLYGTAMIFANIGSTVFGLGLFTAIVQRKNLTEEHLATAYTTNVISGLIVTLVLIAASPLIAKFYRNSSLLYVTVAISLVFLVNSLSSPHYALLTKSFQFKKLALIGLAATVISGAVAVSLGLKGFGIWSLVAASLVGPVVVAISVISLSQWRPRFGFDWQAFKDLFNFGVTVMLSNLIWRLTTTLDIFFIGKYVGFAALGHYSRAHGLVILTADKASALINSVAFPAYSEIQDKQTWLQIGYLKATRVAALMLFPVASALAVLAPEFVPLVYGSTWSGTIVPLRILSLATVISVAYTMSGTVLLAIGRAKVYSHCQIIRLVLIVSAVWVGRFWGLRGVCWAVCLVNLTYLFITQSFVNKFLGVNIKRSSTNLLPPLTLAAGMGLVLYIYKTGAKWVLHLSPYLHLGTSLVVGVLAYFFLMKIFHFKEVDAIYKESIGKFKEKFSYVLRTVRAV